jgi:hypothetical protein
MAFMPHSVRIELDRPRQLRYDVNAVAAVEDELGLGLVALVKPDRIGYQVLRVLLWGGLRHEDATLTVDDAGDLVQSYIENGGTIVTMMEKVNLAFRASGLSAGEAQPPVSVPAPAAEAPAPPNDGENSASPDSDCTPET